MQTPQWDQISVFLPKLTSDSLPDVAAMLRSRDDQARPAEISRNCPATGNSFLTTLLHAFSMTAA